MIRKLLTLSTVLICLPLAIFAQAPGNNCGAAVALALPTVPGNFISTGAQSTLGLGDDFLAGTYCTSGLYGGGEDGVYSINVPAAGSYTFEYLAAGNTYKILSIHSACAPTLGNCVGGFTTGFASNGTETITLAAGTYYLIIDTWPSPTYADFTLNITYNGPPPAAPSNDDCSGAIELTADLNCNFTTYTNLAATNSSEPNPPCAFYQGGDVWFYVEVPPSGEINIDTDTGVITDGGMALYSGTCGALTLVECDDDDSANGLMPYISQTGLTPGDIYYIRVWEYGGNNNGEFDICVTTVIPPGNNGVTICENDPSEAMTSDLTCTTGGEYIAGDDDNGSTLFEPAITATLSTGITYTLVTTIFAFGNTTQSGAFNWNITGGTVNGGATNINGVLTAATDPIAPRPIIFIESDDPCEFVADTSNYVEHTFTVDADGTYVFEMADNPIDLMGYIYTGPFTPGTCPTQVDLEWYADPVGGTALATGNIFDPVGVDPALPDTSTAGTYDYYVECPSNPGVRIQIDYVINACVPCTTWTAGANSTNWYAPGNWDTGVVPTDLNCVVIPPTSMDPILTYPGAPIPPTPGNALNLTVETGATLIIDSEKILKVTEWITVEPGGTLRILTGGSLVQDDPAFANTGNIEMQRTVTGGVGPQDYVYWSSPVDNFGVLDISPGTNANFIWEWIPEVGGNFGTWVNSTDDPMVAGKGYIVRDVIGTATADTPLFVGTPKNGDITVPISRGTYTGLDYTGPGDTMVTAQDDNWNLLGNPYPSAISYTQFIADNGNIDGTIYFWTHQTAPSAAENSPFYSDYLYSYSANDYIDNNYTGSNPPGFNGFIGAGQAFFALMTDFGAATQTVTFNNNQRGSLHDNSVFYSPPPNGEQYASDEIERHRIWLDLISPQEEATSILIGYVEGATNDDDRLYDGYEFPTSEISFYSWTTEGDPKKMSIQGRALPFSDQDVVPLGVSIPYDGVYNIAINTLDGLFDGDTQDIFLEDTYENVLHNLRESPYSFDAIDGNIEDRFILRFNGDTLGTEEFNSNDITIIATENGIKVNSTSQPIEDIVIYDLVGRVIVDIRDINELETIVNDSQLSSSTYIVKATLSDGRYKFKKVIVR